MREEGRGKGRIGEKGEKSEKKIEGKKVGGREVTCGICGSE